MIMPSKLTPSPWTLPRRDRAQEGRRTCRTGDQATNQSDDKNSSTKNPQQENVSVRRMFVDTAKSHEGWRANPKWDMTRTGLWSKGQLRWLQDTLPRT